MGRRYVSEQHQVSLEEVVVVAEQEGRKIEA